MGKLLWSPSKDRIESTNMWRFMQFVNERYGKEFEEYESLYAWSVTDIPGFWESAWDFMEIKASQTYDRAIEDVARMPGANWFPGARLNFAENLLRFSCQSF